MLSYDGFNRLIRTPTAFLWKVKGVGETTTRAVVIITRVVVIITRVVVIINIAVVTIIGLTVIVIIGV